MNPSSNSKQFDRLSSRKQGPSTGRRGGGSLSRQAEAAMLNDVSAERRAAAAFQLNGSAERQSSSWHFQLRDSRVGAAKSKRSEEHLYNLQLKGAV